MTIQTELWQRKDGIVVKAVERDRFGRFGRRTNQTIEYAIIAKRR